MGVLGFRERLAVGGVALVLVVALASTGLRWATGSFDDHLDLVATFDHTGHGLDGFSEVRIRGVRVGSVDAIALDDDQRARVELDLDPGTRVPVGTVASIQATSIFGPTFIALEVDPDALDGPLLADGDELRHTRENTELAAMLTRVGEVLDAADPEALSALTSSAARVLSDLAPRVGPVLEDARTLTDVAVDHLDDGAAILDDLERLTDEVADWGDQVGALAPDAREALSVLPEHEDDLERLLVTGAAAAHEVSRLLEAFPAAFSDLAEGLLSALVPPLAAVAGNLEFIPAFAEVIAVFFGELASIMHLDGPDGQRLGAIELGISPDLCEVLELLQCHEGARAPSSGGQPGPAGGPR